MNPPFVVNVSFKDKKTMDTEFLYMLERMKDYGEVVTYEQMKNLGKMIAELRYSEGTASDNKRLRDIIDNAIYELERV